MSDKKFELKIKLNNAIDNKCFSKEDFEWVLKNILKSNQYLIKHFSLFKNNIGGFLNDCNVLLEDDFFVSDKVLIIWIARYFNKIVENNYLIHNVLRSYLKEKNESYVHNRCNNRYYKQLGKRTSIYCDDDCFNEYLPIHTSSLYPEFDDELLEDKYSWSCETLELSDDEINNIMDFKFNNLDKKDLLVDINNAINEYHKEKFDSYYYNNKIDKIISYINKFEGVSISTNTKTTLDNTLNISIVYDLLRCDNFEYNVDDDYIILEKEYFRERKYSNVESRIIKVVSFNDIIQFIDFDKWIKYMSSHDINNINELYIDKWYKGFETRDDVKKGISGYIEYNFETFDEGVNEIVKRITNKHSEIERKFINLLTDTRDNPKIIYDITQDMVFETTPINIGENRIVLGDEDNDVEQFKDVEYIKECINKKIESEK